MASDTSTSPLLALPDSCLLAVMQCCASDTHSVLSAATAHSRLQRAAVAALSSITAEEPGADSLLEYLEKHGQHVCSLDLCEPCRGNAQLEELPPSLTKLDSLQLKGIVLQLQPDGDAQGVLRAVFPLTRLEISSCSLLDGAQGLAAALAQLPDLQHLSVDDVRDEDGRAVHVRTAVLTQLTKLTSLKLGDIACQGRNSSSDSDSDSDSSNSDSSSSDLGAALQPLQVLTRLADLQLSPVNSMPPGCVLTADMLSGAVSLTRLGLTCVKFEPRALAGKTQLQHLTLQSCRLGTWAELAQLLSELQNLTQLTHLDLGALRGGWGGQDVPYPPPAAYASLTASSQLQHLGFHSNTLPSAAWQYMCPPGRALPQLQYLDIGFVKEADRSSALPDTSALVSCCPGLQTLKISIPCSTAQLAPLQRLTGLHTLVVGAGHADDLEGVQVLCQLTGLEELDLWVARRAQAHILQLTQLTGLTALMFAHSGGYKKLRCNPQVSWG
jgi:hypothetical protein